MKIRYFLKQVDKAISERTISELVYASVSNKFANQIDGKVVYGKFEYSLETYVKPQHFGAIQTKRGSTNFVYDSKIVEKNKIHNSNLRQAILDFEQNINEVNLYFRNLGAKPSKDNFKAQLEKVTGRSQGHAKTTTVAKYIRDHISNLTQIMGTGKSNAVTDNTIGNYRSLLSVVENYEEVTGVQITFANLKEKYWELWDNQDNVVRGVVTIQRDGVRKKATDKNGIGTNTVAGYQNILRQICNDAISDGIDVSLSTSDKKLLLKTQKSSRQYDINNDDLLTVYRHSPSTERLQKAKDYIIFSSLSGMRFQSVIEVLGEVIQTYDKDGRKFDYVHTVQSKTKTECLTPLFAAAKEVIVRNGGKLPKFSNYTGTINKQIKDLFKEAGITYKVPVTQHYYKDGSVTVMESVDKVVSSHATRKGFVTNLYKFGVNTTTAKLVTHPDTKGAGTTDSYNKITKETRAVRFVDEVLANIADNELYVF